MSELKVRGTVKWFQNQKGFGFIQRDDKKGDVFVHYSSIIGSDGYRSLSEGEKVEFDVVDGDKGQKAVGVKKLS